MRKPTDWIRPEIVFLAIAPLLGLACLTLTPPFQVADEPEHFFRIVQIAEGHLLGERRGTESGGHVPAALSELADYYVDGNPVSGEVRWDRRKWAAIYPHLTQRAEGGGRGFRDFRGMNLYAPAVYVPQVVGVGVVRALNLPPLWLVYAGRFCALAAFVGLVFWAIRLTPVCPWGFAVLALLPATISQAASLSADSLTNALLFFFAAWVFRCVYAKDRIARKDLVGMLMLGVGIGLCKSAYILSLGLIFLIPPAKFGGRKRYWIASGGVAGTALLVAALWSAAASATYVPLFDDVDAWAQAVYILSHPLHFAGMVLVRLLHAVRFLFLGERIGLLQEFVGALGWNTVYVNIGQTSLAVLFWCAIAEKNEKVGICEWHRWGVAAILAGTILMIAAANYMVWCPPGAPALALFGRYFHPIAPMALLLLHNRSFVVRCAEKWRVLIPAYFVGVAVATVYVIGHAY